MIELLKYFDCKVEVDFSNYHPFMNRASRATKLDLPCYEITIEGSKIK